ncbi:MAG: hypothetical protein D6808_03395 [Candidatus Dadabacteria bacterium]|nr:MAG: hypothetical protein D6808_03395 [Candidatus Dadabacteria bacterium]
MGSIFCKERDKEKEGKEFTFIVGTVIFAVMAWKELRYGTGWMPYFVLGSIFFSIGFVLPSVGFIAKRALEKLGESLGHIATPIVLLFIYWCSIVPVGVLQRFFGRDELMIRRKKGLKSYWIPLDNSKNKGNYYTPF